MSPPLRLPVETIERILYFAFGGDLPPATPSSCRVPAASPNHLFLVSKGFSSLVSASLRWRSISITRSIDWARLWDPKRGLFAGETGKERAGWVEEIRVNLDPRATKFIDPTLLMEAYRDLTTDQWRHCDRRIPLVLSSAILVPTVPAPLPRLRRLCFFVQETGFKLAISGTGTVSIGQAEWDRAEDQVWNSTASAKVHAFCAEAEGRPIHRDLDLSTTRAKNIRIWQQTDREDCEQNHTRRRTDAHLAGQQVAARLLWMTKPDLYSIRLPHILPSDHHHLLSRLLRVPGMDSRRLTAYCPEDGYSVALIAGTRRSTLLRDRRTSGRDFAPGILLHSGIIRSRRGAG